MPPAGGDQHHAGHAVDDAPPLKEMAEPVPDGQDPPGVGKPEHESGDDQRDETEDQRAVLDPLIDRHPQVEPVRHRLLDDQALLDADLAAHLPDKVEPVVRDHASDDRDDQPDVDGRDPVDRRLLAVGGGRHVHRGRGEAGVRAGVALAARLREIGRVDRRLRIRRGENRVGPVAARAIDRDHRAATGGQAMEAVGEGLDAVVRQAVALVQLDRGVAGAADHQREVARGDRGVQIGRIQDLVLPMAGGADGRVRGAGAQGRGMGALPVLARLRRVAAGAGRRDVLEVDAGARGQRPGRFVAAVAVDAVGGRRVPAGQAHPVRAPGIGDDEAAADGRARHHPAVVPMAAEAEAGLRLLELEPVGARRHGLKMAADAGRRLGPARRRGGAVGGAQELRGGLGMALAAGGGEFRAGKGRLGAGGRRDAVRTVAGYAIGLGRGNRRGLGKIGVEGVGFRHAVVAAPAIDRGDRQMVRPRGAQAVVAVGAGERGVNRAADFLRVHEKGDQVAVLHPAQVKPAVAAEAGLVRVGGAQGPGQAGDRQPGGGQRTKGPAVDRSAHVCPENRTLPDSAR